MRDLEHDLRTLERWRLAAAECRRRAAALVELAADLERTRLERAIAWDDQDAQERRDLAATLTPRADTVSDPAPPQPLRHRFL